MDIHPRAMVDPQAILGDGCVVGPDAIIGAGVVLGPGCSIGPRAFLTGKTVLGSRVKVGVGALIGGDPQDLAYRGAASATEIGDDTVIREYVTVHRGTQEGTRTWIGRNCYLMAGSHVAHNCRLEDHVILVNNVLLAGYVEVGARAFVGGAAVVHQFTRIGAYAMIRGLTRLGRDVPPYCMATHTNTLSGLNKVGLRRNGFDDARRRRILRAVELLCHSPLNRTQALEAIRVDADLQHADIDLLVQFAETTKRGLCGWRDTTAGAEDE
ncbi:MAG: acyl-ACP--UDP-N-acetylglucosamine O-acyltransferase [Candidatus Methylacidiphilales bacterium]|nr:acyl-ACP--UDP-N-acetylglucosamine O-acyltransferase [Candidatus Methylacidiphilales bacterium]